MRFFLTDYEFAKNASPLARACLSMIDVMFWLLVLAFLVFIVLQCVPLTVGWIEWYLTPQG